MRSRAHPRQQRALLHTHSVSRSRTDHDGRGRVSPRRPGLPLALSPCSRAPQSRRADPWGWLSLCWGVSCVLQGLRTSRALPTRCQGHPQPPLLAEAIGISVDITKCQAVSSLGENQRSGDTAVTLAQTYSLPGRVRAPETSQARFPSRWVLGCVGVGLSVCRKCVAGSPGGAGGCCFARLSPLQRVRLRGVWNAPVGVGRSVPRVLSLRDVWLPFGDGKQDSADVHPGRVLQVEAVPRQPPRPPAPASPGPRGT